MHTVYHKKLLSVKSLVNIRKLIKQSVIATNNMRRAWMITLTANKEPKKQVAWFWIAQGKLICNVWMLVECKWAPSLRQSSLSFSLSLISQIILDRVLKLRDAR